MAKTATNYEYVDGVIYTVEKVATPMEEDLDIKILKLEESIAQDEAELKELQDIQKEIDKLPPIEPPPEEEPIA